MSPVTRDKLTLKSVKPSTPLANGQDMNLPTHSWRRKVPPALAKELAALRDCDEIIRAALRDSQVAQRFIANPVSVFDDLHIPLSDELRHRLQGPTGMEKLAVPRRFFLPGNPAITPDVTARIGEHAEAPRQATRRLYNWNPFATLFKPTGLLNHGYPVVYEITKSCIHDMIAQWFDRGPLSDIIEDLTEKVTDPVLKGLIKVADLLYKQFDLDLDLGMPSGMSTSFHDILTVTLRVPSPNAAPTNNVNVSIMLRIAASIVVDHSDPQKEQFYMDLANHLALCEARITIENVPAVGTQTLDLSTVFEHFLKTHHPKINVFFDVPVDRSGVNELKPTQIDVKIIDDVSSADCDAIALLMSFKDMGPGDRNAFTHSFISGGSGLSIDFNWLRAKILDDLEKALNLPTPIDRATGIWTGQAPIVNGDGAVLTFLALGVLQGTRDIFMLASVRQNGDCYTATGSMSAAMSVYVENGKLIFKPPQFTEPSVNIDIPWYCYVLSIVVGAALGGLLFDVIGTVIGGTIAPLMLGSIQGIAEGTVESVVNSVNTAVQNQTAGIQQIDLGKLKSVLQYVSIDDLLTLHSLSVSDSLPALMEKTVFIPNGGYLDVVNGQIAPMTGQVGHLGWSGMGSSRVLMTIGKTALALVGSLDPECVTRYSLYHCDFKTTQRLMLNQLASQTGLVYALRTDDGHYAHFTVTAIAVDGLWVHYKTYPREVGESVVAPTLSVCGRFSPRLVHEISTASQPQFQSLAGIGLGKWGSWVGANAHWQNTGEFYINWIGFRQPLSLHWKVQGQALQDKTGLITVNGAQVQYEIYGSQISLVVDPIVMMDVTIEAEVQDALGRQAAASIIATTVQGDYRIDRTGATISPDAFPSMGDYMVAYKKHVGPWVEVDPEYVSDAGYRVDREDARQSVNIDTINRH